VTPADVIPESEIGLYVQDTMNELEFIMGAVTTPFGALRASLGYPQPWAIKYVEIGNEDDLGGSEASYIAYRFKAYYDAISAKYPDIIIISSSGDTLEQTGNSATDFHEYTRPDQFVSQFGYWDNIANRDHLTLIGEYANIQWNVPTITGVDWSAPKLPFPIWVGAVAETVFSLGAERNGYGIIGMSYAPGFQNINSWEWSVCLPLLPF
jgi:alpha-N-arabinofuranosidase